MSRRVGPIDLVVEWSPRGVVAYDGRTRSLVTDLKGLSGREAIVGVSRRSVFVRTTRVPEATPEQIRQILTVRLVELFPLPATELAFDFELTDDVAEGGRLALVAAMPAVELRKLQADMHAAGIRVRQVLPIAIGSGLLATSIGHPQSAVVQTTEGGVGIDIVVQGLLRYSRVAGSGDIVSEVCRTFTVAGVPCSDIVAAGELTFPEADFKTSSNSLEALTTGEVPKLNLETPEAIEGRVRKLRGQRQRSALLLMLGAIAFAAYVYTDYSDAATAADATQTNIDKQQKGRKDALKRAQAEVATATAMAAPLDVAFKPAQPVSDVIALFTYYAPAGVWLTGINVERGKPVIIRGTATGNTAVTTYFQSLSALSQGADHRLRDVKLVFANNSNIEKVPVVEFSISAFPVGNLPLAQQARGATK